MKIVKKGDLTIADRIDVVFTALHRETMIIIHSLQPGRSAIDEIERIFARARLAAAEILEETKK